MTGPAPSREDVQAAIDSLRRRVESLEHDRLAHDGARDREAELRSHNVVLRSLSRSEALARGDVTRAFAEVTEAAARTIGVDRASIWLYTHGRATIRCVDLYERPRDAHSGGLELRASDYPAYFRALEDERSLAAHDARSDPRTSEFRAGYLEPLGITSMMDAVIRADGRPVGVICHEHIGEPRDWTLEEQTFAGSLADFTSMTLQAHRQALMLRELDHRVRNNVAILESIAHQTLMASPDLDSFGAVFLGRLRSLGIAHDLLAGRSWEGAELREMLERLVAPHNGVHPNACRIEGPPAVLPRDVAAPLCMALNELLTNAVKYGSLSCPAGDVSVRWTLDDGRLDLEWREGGGPPVTAPSEAGFGTGLVQELIGYQLHGKAEVTYDADGLRCRITVPLSAFDDGATLIVPMAAQGERVGQFT